MRDIELLAPAANADIAIEAIKHGADAIYIGPPSHGARKSASNSLDDIRRVVDFAHPFGVKVYSTVNTIVYDSELLKVESLIGDLYKIGVDALIVQDMGILRMEIPPIALHASTQCDTRTPEKARFLEEAGFSQIVLARELTLAEIRSIYESVNVPLECFVHGALCVSYSGRCHASQVTTGRSANRGECAQICRWPFTLTDAAGKVLERNRHLLSLKDFNLSDRLEELLDAGASSLKIEGRLKDASYVKNIVGFYRKRLDEIIRNHPDTYRRSSAGVSELTFRPQADKSFNRGFTHYFIDSRRPASITSPLTPKSMGEKIKDISQLNNGDGISYFNDRNEYEGVMVNGIKGNRIIGNRTFQLPKGASIHRTFDIKWQKEMARPTATRRIDLDVIITDTYISATDGRGISATLSLPKDLQPARNRRTIRDSFDKFGNTIYRIRNFTEDNFTLFIPASQLSDLRRQLIRALESASKATYRFDYRRKENSGYPYPSKQLDYRDNVANRLADQFYREHGVTSIQPAIEIGPQEFHQSDEADGQRGQRKKYDEKKERIVMTTRHCILREMGKCLQRTPPCKRNFQLPLFMTSGKNKFRLKFNCEQCEMEVLTTENPD
ncbi:MAG: U32 family peptidase [Muribaculaceae bacterium]|nr:U32 family peptidase [Muribaculaceae bacterium]